MNLGLSAAQYRLTDILSRNEAAADPESTGWDVFGTVGISELLAPEPGAAPVLNQLDWCLVLEELGAGCRDHTLIRSVRTFIDVFTGRAADPRAAEAFRLWARGTFPASVAPAQLVERSGSGETASWRVPAGLPAPLVELAEVTLDAPAARAVADRELLAVAAYAVGIGRHCLEVAQRRAGERVIAGRRLLEYQGTSHRLARCAVDLCVARVGLWRAANAEDDGTGARHRAPAAAAACLSAALDCAHNVVQVYGAAGTSDPDVVRLFRTACSLAAITGSARTLWQAAGERWLPSPV